MSTKAVFPKWLWVPIPGRGLMTYDGAISEPTRGDVLRALEALDGDTYSMCVIAEGEPDPHGDAPYSGRALIVGGGKPLYLCEYYADEHSDPVRVCDSKAVGDPVEIKRGEWMEVEPAFCVDDSLLRQAVDCFLETGTMSPTMEWRPE